MTGIIALIIRILSNPYSNVIQKKLCAKGLKPLWVSFFSYFLLSLFMLIPALFINYGKFSAIFWLNVILAGVIGALGNKYLTQAVKYGELSVLGPINSYKSVISVIFAFFLLGEIPSLAGFFGILLIAAGSYFIFDTQKEGFSFGIFLRRDIKYRLYALVLTALEAVFIKKIIIMSDALTSFIFWCTSSAFFSFLFYTAGKNKIMPALNLSIKKYFGYFLLLGFSMFLMQFSTNIVFEHMNVSSALALFQLSSLVSVILGRQYFGEKNIGKKILGAIIMSAGAAVVILY